MLAVLVRGRAVWALQSCWTFAVHCESHYVYVQYVLRMLGALAWALHGLYGIGQAVLLPNGWSVIGACRCGDIG